MSSSEELSARVSLAEARAKEAESSCQQAARYGQQLLDKLKDSEMQVEAKTQEKHELQLKYNAKVAAHINYEEEFDGLRKQITTLKQKCGQSKYSREMTFEVGTGL